MDIKQSLVLPVGSSWVMDGSLGRLLSIHFDVASEMSTYICLCSGPIKVTVLDSPYISLSANMRLAGPGMAQA